MPFRDELNPQQREAVEAAEGPLLILAGAGSGKTRVITNRIAHLVQNLGVPADSILAVTFTNKAASEMAERVAHMVGRRSFAKPLISTFHSFCVRVLRRDIEKLQVNGKGLTKQFVIYDEKDQQLLVKAALRRLGIDDKQFKPSAVLSRISWAKNHMIDPQEYYLQSADPKTERVAHVYEIYRRELAKANAMDFDDLLLEAVRLLKAVPAVREYYNHRFHYIQVDEYQDTNRPQYELMRLLAGERHNVCAVGDEDQSIYSWRGADIRNILEFERDFPNARIIRLEQNYRSTQNILEAASVVVANNVKRKGKNLWTSRQGGAQLGFYEAPDGENEALFVADYISKYMSQAAEEGKTARAAVLYRTNSQSRLFEEAMRRYQLKYHVVGGFSFYERAEVKDLIAYLKVLHNSDDSIALQRVINTPARGIGKSTMEVIERVALETGQSIWNALGEVIRRQLLPVRALNALRGFREIIEDARAMHLGTYVARLEETAAAAVKEPKPASIQVPDEQVALELAASADGDTSFEFGGTEIPRPNVEMTDSENVPTVLALPDEYTETGQRLFLVPINKWNDIQKVQKKLAQKAARYGAPEPRIVKNREWSAQATNNPEYLLVTVEGERPVICGWTFLGAIRHKDGINVVHPLPGAPFPESYKFAGAKCDHCNKVRRRNSTYILQHESGDLKQVGSQCVEDFVGQDPEGHLCFIEGVFTLEETLKTISMEARHRLKGTAALPKLPPTYVNEGAPVRSIAEFKRIYHNNEDSEVLGAHLPAEEQNGGDHNGGEEDRGGHANHAWWLENGTSGPASTADLLKFLIDRTGYIKQLEAEDTPESTARVENLHELINAGLDSHDRGETLGEFLDHAALVSDADDYDEKAQITLMTLHAAKGLEFPLVFLVGLEEGLFPHSRTFNSPDDVEEERRLCYVGMTRAMDTLVLTRARYRRRYGTDMPEASVVSRFLEEVPARLLQDLGSPRSRAPHPSRSEGWDRQSDSERHYSYEDEDQRPAHDRKRTAYTGPTYNSIDNIADFFASRGKKFTRPKIEVEEPSGRRGFRPGQRVRHPKYGEGIVYQREGDGEDAKLTVKFHSGLKKLVEKYAQLERA